MNTKSNYDKIAQRAYELWEKDGHQPGKETQHWLQAESEIKAQENHGSSKNRSSQEETEAERKHRVFAM